MTCPETHPETRLGTGTAPHCKTTMETCGRTEAGSLRADRPSRGRPQQDWPQQDWPSRLIEPSNVVFSLAFCERARLDFELSKANPLPDVAGT